MPSFAPLTSGEKEALRSAPASSLPQRLSSLLKQNHTRVIDLFRSLDKNGDGEVTRPELAKALSDLGVSASKDELDEMFRTLDPDHSGGIDFRELQKAMMDASGDRKTRVIAAAAVVSTPKTVSPVVPGTPVSAGGAEGHNYKEVGRAAVLEAFTSTLLREGSAAVAADRPALASSLNRIISALASSGELTHSAERKAIAVECKAVASRAPSNDENRPVQAAAVR